MIGPQKSFFLILALFSNIFSMAACMDNWWFGTYRFIESHTPRWLSLWGGGVIFPVILQWISLYCKCKSPKFKKQLIIVGMKINIQNCLSFRSQFSRGEGAGVCVARWLTGWITVLWTAYQSLNKLASQHKREKANCDRYKGSVCLKYHQLDVLKVLFLFLFIFTVGAWQATYTCTQSLAWTYI